MAKLKNTSGKQLTDCQFPIGFLYISFESTNPSSLVGGVWAQVKDVFFLACGDKYKAGTTGGESEHILTIEEMPKHTHKINYSSAAGGNGTGYVYGTSEGENDGMCNSEGGNKPHNNMPPYVAIYAFKRIA